MSDYADIAAASDAAAADTTPHTHIDRRAIVRAVNAALGRKVRARLRGWGAAPDWEAVELVEAELVKAGHADAVRRLCQWVVPGRTSVSQILDDWMRRAAQAGLI